MNLDDFIVGALQGDAQASPDTVERAGEAAALAPELEAQRQLLADGSMWDEPAPGTLDGILGAIAAESAEADPTPPELVAVPADPTAAATDPPGRRRRSRWLTALPAAAAAAVVAVLLVVSTGDDSAEPVTVELAGTELAPEADGRVDLHETPAGVRFELDADGLPSSAPGEFYEAWIVGEGGLVAVGTFRGGDQTADVVLWSGIEIEKVQLFAITIEADDGDVTSSERRVLVGRLRP